MITSKNFHGFRCHVLSTKRSQLAARCFSYIRITFSSHEEDVYTPADKVAYQQGVTVQQNAVASVSVLP
jgi:hypothetical protein